MPNSKQLLCAAAILAAFAFQPARAENKARSLELGLVATPLHFDSETDLANDTGFSALVHYNFTQRHGMELVYTVASTAPKSDVAVQTDISHIKLGYVFTTSRKERLLPYFRVGLGWWNQDVEEDSGTANDRLKGDDDSYLIYSGGGLRIALADWYGIRLGGGVDLLSVVGGMGHLDIQGFGELGVYFRFGGREPGETPEEAPAETPAETPKEPAGETKPPRD